MNVELVIGARLFDKGRFGRRKSGAENGGHKPPRLLFRLWHHWHVVREPLAHFDFVSRKCSFPTAPAPDRRTLAMGALRYNEITEYHEYARGVDPSRRYLPSHTNP
jgi:hypothetical protein